MKLPIISMSEDKGFTLIEIIIVIAIIIGLFAIGSFVDLSLLNRRSISSEQAILVSVLQKARNRAMNNINAQPHGVHINDDEYVLFRGQNYDSNENTNETILKNDKIIISGENDIVFEQLSGNPNLTGDIVLKDGEIIRTITINNAGLIDW